MLIYIFENKIFLLNFLDHFEYEGEKLLRILKCDISYVANKHEFYNLISVKNIEIKAYRYEISDSLISPRYVAPQLIL